MKTSAQIFLKLILIIVITLFALFNYRFISFDKGISKTLELIKSGGNFPPPFFLVVFYFALDFSDYII